MRNATLANRIFFTLIANGILTVALIFIVAVWMVHFVNTLAREAAVDTVENVLQTEINAISKSTVDYAYWDLPYDLIKSGNDGELYANFGSGAADSSTFDFIYVLDGDGTPLYAYHSDIYVSDLGLIDDQVASTFYNTLSATPLEPYEAVTGYSYDNGTMAAVASARIRPDEIGDKTKADFPIMIAGHWLHAARLDMLAGPMMLDQLVLGPPDSDVSASRSKVYLTDIDSAPVGLLHWEPARPGNIVFVAALPIILALSLLSFGAAVFSGRAASVQTKALLDQQQIARTDPLTGLYNRTGLEHIATSSRIIQSITNGQLAVLYLDLNNFKDINDSAGHQAGDRALQLFTKRVGEAIREDDVFARVGGDEFIIVLVDEDPDKIAKVIAKRIQSLSNQPFRTGDKTYRISASVGVAIAAGGQSWNTIQRNADRAMYAAKYASTQKKDPKYSEADRRQRQVTEPAEI